MIRGAFIITLAPPPVRGIGTAGGFKMLVQDKLGRGPAALEAATQDLVQAANKTPGMVQRVQPVQHAHAEGVCRHRPDTGADPGRAANGVFDALQVYLGSAYINDFNILGRTYQVIAQADEPFRRDAARHRQPENPQHRRRRWCRSARVDAVPRHHRAVPGAALQPLSRGRGAGCDAARLSPPATDLATMERLAAERLPDGFGFEWTELAYQQKLAGNTSC